MTLEYSYQAKQGAAGAGALAPNRQLAQLTVDHAEGNVAFLAKPNLAPFRRVALIGGFRPRKCGIATFTTDVYQQLGRYHPEIAIDLHVVDSAADRHAYPEARGVIDADRAADYAVAARRINEDAVDAVWLQHEYGIFGGEDGEMVLDLVDAVAAPLIVTLHTVLEHPTDRQRAILRHLVRRASQVMVMARRARDLLVERYGAQPGRIKVIEHGAPDRALGHGEAFRAAAGITGRKVLMTFGLLGPGKGLETVIEALPAIAARHPEVLYRIVGATHPNLVAREQEAYRERLTERARELGVAEHIAWDNRFLDNEELLDQLQACDIYLTPYPNLQQATSGTLSYAVAMGRAVVSTPYVHARELLAGGVGRLVDPGDPAMLAEAVNVLFDDPATLEAMQRRAWQRGREMIWPQFASAGARLIEAVVAPVPAPANFLATPGIRAVTAMSDSTGMLQHAIGVVPDRRHGYCLDDNVRALMLMGVATGMPADERQRLATTYAAFIQHAWNPDAGRFRNFMRFDRGWCEEVGSEDSNGRALWALGRAIGEAPDPGLRAWARQWFDVVIDPVGELDSPRTVAFAMLGAVAAIKAGHDCASARSLVTRGGDMLCNLLDAARRPDWAWFEAMLSYDNPRLPEALIRAALLEGRNDWLFAGLDTLRFIADRQTASAGHFRAVGSETFGKPYAQLPFDQQPLEAWAAVDAAAAAWTATGDAVWRDHAQSAYRWYLGANDRGRVLAELSSGLCRDGLTPHGRNENCGAESILAFQLAHYGLRAVMQSGDHASGEPGAGTISAAAGSLVETRLETGRPGQPLAHTR